MAILHGKNADFSFGGQDIEDELNSVVQNAAVNEADATAFGDTYQVYLAGKKNVAWDVQGYYDPVASQAVDLMMDNMEANTTATVIFDPTGSGPGADTPTYSTTSSGLTGAYVDTLNLSFPVGEMASFSAHIQASGATVRNVA